MTGQNFSAVSAVTFGSTAVTTTPCPATPGTGGCFAVESLSKLTVVTPACPGCTTANITISTSAGTHQVHLRRGSVQPHGVLP